MEDSSKRIYYSMGEVSEMLDVNPSLLRFWEKNFAVIKPHKNKKGNRMFTPEDVENLKRIYHLVKVKGMTLAGAEKALNHERKGTRAPEELMERLLSIRAILEQVRQELGTDGSGTVGVFTQEEFLGSTDELTPVSSTKKATPLRGLPIHKNDAAARQTDSVEKATPADVSTGVAKEEYITREQSASQIHITNEAAASITSVPTPPEESFAQADHASEHTEPHAPAPKPQPEPRDEPASKKPPRIVEQTLF